MSDRFTYMEMEMLVRRAMIQGQDAVALHLAMAREVLMKEEFGDIMRHPVMAARIETMIQSEVLKASSGNPPPAVGSEPNSHPGINPS
jgi:DNA-binding cell septation regulator SpoVG